MLSILDLLSVRLLKGLPPSIENEVLQVKKRIFKF